MASRGLRVPLLAVALSLAALAPAQSEPAQIPSRPRDAWQLPDSVVSALRLRPGMIVADLGAGSGYFTHRLARAVGAEGRVLALDIDLGALEKNRARAIELGLANVETRLVMEGDPGLAVGEVDLVFVCNTWQFFPNRFCYAKRLAAVLESGARLAVISRDRTPGIDSSRSSWTTDRYSVRRQAEAAGFRLVADHGLPKQFFLVFDKARATIFDWIADFRYLHSEVAIGGAPFTAQAAAALRERGFLQLLDASVRPNPTWVALANKSGLRYALVDRGTWIESASHPKLGVSLVVGISESEIVDLLRKHSAPGWLVLPTCR